MIVGHNPSMHEFSESFSGKFIEKFSTCGLASFEFDDKWANVCEDSGSLLNLRFRASFVKFCRFVINRHIAS